MTMATEQWVKQKDAAKACGVSAGKISRMAAKGEIKTKRDLRDERVVLVDLVELKTLFGIR